MYIGGDQVRDDDSVYDGRADNRKALGVNQGAFSLRRFV